MLSSYKYIIINFIENDLILLRCLNEKNNDCTCRIKVLRIKGFFFVIIVMQHTFSFSVWAANSRCDNKTELA